MRKAEALAQAFLDAAVWWRQKPQRELDGQPNLCCAAALERLAGHTRELPDFDHRIAALAFVEVLRNDGGHLMACPTGEAQAPTLTRILSQDGLHASHASDPDELLTSLYEAYLLEGKREAEHYASQGPP